MADAGKVLEGLPRNKLYPLGFSPAYVLIPLFAFILLGLCLFDFSSLNPAGEKTRERLARAGKAIERFSKEKIRETIGLNDPSLGEPYRQLEEIAKDLQNQSLKPEKLLLTLGEMKKEALAERLRLTRKLEKELNGDGTPGPANPFSLPKELTTTKDLEKLTEQLKDLFEGSLPESIGKDIARIGEKLELEQFLDKTINQAIPSEPTGDERSLLSKREKGYTGEGETREKSGKQPSGETRSFLALEKEQTRLPTASHGRARAGGRHGRQVNGPKAGRKMTASRPELQREQGKGSCPLNSREEGVPPSKKGGAHQARNQDPLSRCDPCPFLEKRKMAGRKSRRKSRLPIEGKWKRLCLKKRFPRSTGNTLNTIFYPSGRKKEKSRMTKINEQAERVKESLEQLQTELARAIVGQEELIRQVFICLLCGGHALIEGVPGLGKTLIVKSLGEVLNLKYSRIQFTPDLMPADIIGTNIVNQDADGNRFFEFYQGPIFGQIILADEINRATPKTQSALLEAMQEQAVTVFGKKYPLEPPFIVLATQNPLEMEGTYPLPEAQVDRFFFKLKIGYPTSDQLLEIIDKTTEEALPVLSQTVGAASILEMKSLVREVPYGLPCQRFCRKDGDGQPPPRKKFRPQGAAICSIWGQSQRCAEPGIGRQGHGPS